MKTCYINTLCKSNPLTDKVKIFIKKHPENFSHSG